MIYIIIILISILLFALFNKLMVGQRRLLSEHNYRDISTNWVFAVFVMLSMVVLLSLFSGLRGMSVGVDTGSIYYDSYYLPYCINNQPYNGTEIGFYVIIKAGYFLFHSYNGVLITASAITIGFSLAGLWHFKERVNIIFAFLIYLSFIYFTSFNTVRQYIAVSIIFFAFRYIDKRQYVRYFIAATIAFTVHNSALICLVIPIFKLIENRKKLVFALFILIVTGFIFLPDVVDVVINQFGFGAYASREYIDKINFELSITNLSIVILYAPAFIVIFVFRKKLIKKDNRNKLLLLIFAIAFVCALLKLYMVWLSRLMVYFSLPMCILLPQCIKLCDTGKGSMALKVMLVMYCFGYFVINYIILGNGMIYPYVSI